MRSRWNRTGNLPPRRLLRTLPLPPQVDSRERRHRGQSKCRQCHLPSDSQRFDSSRPRPHPNLQHQSPCAHFASVLEHAGPIESRPLRVTPMNPPNGGNAAGCAGRKRNPEGGATPGIIVALTAMLSFASCRRCCRGESSLLLWGIVVQGLPKPRYQSKIAIVNSNPSPKTPSKEQEEPEPAQLAALPHFVVSASGIQQISQPIASRILHPLNTLLRSRGFGVGFAAGGAARKQSRVQAFGSNPEIGRPCRAG